MSLGRKAALKLLPTAFTRDQERVRRFEREARATPIAKRHAPMAIGMAGRVLSLLAFSFTAIALLLMSGIFHMLSPFPPEWSGIAAGCSLIIKASEETPGTCIAAAMTRLR